ncbi:MAG: hypothetical protein DRJ03_02060 [Chloroflexi bacterium]|nr:MAG: hypothetical protein DRJ03_02060 [Chloroflexota bacterium]
MTEPKQGWFQTSTGTQFTLPNFNPRLIDIEDIAHALSQQCRFNGHTWNFYSVAEHSVRVSKEVPVEDRLWGLLHDASEAYLGDVVKPLKVLLPDYQKMEDDLMRVICGVFDLPSRMPESVKRADLVLLATERRDMTFDLDSNNVAVWDDLVGVDPLVGRISSWSYIEAKQRFLQRFEELT